MGQQHHRWSQPRQQGYTAICDVARLVARSPSQGSSRHSSGHSEKTRKYYTLWCQLVRNQELYRAVQFCPVTIQAHLGPVPDLIQAAATALVTIKTVRHLLPLHGMIGLHFSPVSSFRPAMLAAGAGGDWRNFNASQRQRRADMLCLYGTTKRLVPRSKGFAVTGSLDNSVHALFVLQVSRVIRHRFWGCRGSL